VDYFSRKTETGFGIAEKAMFPLVVNGKDSRVLRSLEDKDLEELQWVKVTVPRELTDGESFGPVYEVDGVCFADIIPADPMMLEEFKSMNIVGDVDRLWKAAHDLETARISGVAVGLLTIGVMMQKPKALEVSAWSGSLWAEYYTRKAAVIAGAAPDCDFSAFDNMPHDVPALREELGM